MKIVKPDMAQSITYMENTTQRRCGPTLPISMAQSACPRVREFINVAAEILLKPYDPPKSSISSGKMAKCELSSTLKNLKFMQRAKAKEEKKAAEEEAVLQVDGAFGSSASIKRKCIVVMEGDPHPGAVKGRMSFQSFNPSIDKLNQEASDSCIPQTSMSTPENQNNGISDRLEDPHATSPKNNFDTDLKRKQPDIDPHVQSPHRSKSIYIEGDGQPSQEKKRKPYLGKEKKQEKWDWNVLRRAKVEKQEGLNMPH